MQKINFPLLLIAAGLPFAIIGLLAFAAAYLYLPADGSQGILLGMDFRQLRASGLVTAVLGLAATVLGILYLARDRAQSKLSNDG